MLSLMKTGTLPPPDSLQMATFPRPSASTPVPIDPSHAEAPGHFTLGMNLASREVTTRIPAWSVGLKWVTYEFSELISAGTPLPTPECVDEHLETVERPLTEAWLAKDFEVHMERHSAALKLGLSAGGHNDLPTARIRIDRLLKQMLIVQNVDLIGVADAISRQDDYLSFCVNCLEYALEKVDGTMFMLRQNGLHLPVFAAWVPLGSATYCGYALDIAEKLPETICAGVVGRPLGELVATGVPELDARRITRVSTWDGELDDYWHSTEATRISLAPDHVAIERRDP